MQREKIKKFLSEAKNLYSAHRVKVWLAIALIPSAYVFYCYVTDAPLILTYVEWFGFTAYIITTVLVYYRLKNQEELLGVQTRREIDDRFHSAIALLGNSETSARTGAIYSLYHLAIESEKYRKQIAEILCSHIRSKTEENAYREKHNSKPSNEIQTAIDVLFKNSESLQGLYVQFTGNSLPQANLFESYLVGANFARAHCQGVSFDGAHCNEADFQGANCQEASFVGTYCQKAWFDHAQCQRAKFKESFCQKAIFFQAQCQRTSFEGAQCQKAQFLNAQCQKTSFISAECYGMQCMDSQFQMANFEYALCQGGNFMRSNFQRANFINANFQGANFARTGCQGANFGGAKFQGSCALSERYKFQLSQRINMNTDLKTMIIAGQITKETINAIESAKEYMEDWEYKKIWDVITQNEGHSDTCAVDAIPPNMMTGVLEDTPEIRQIIKEIEGKD